MSEPVPLSFEKHGKLYLRELTDFTQFSSQHLVPIVLQEFYGLAAEFPLVFVRNSESGDFIPVAMMSLTRGRNLYCQTPEWSHPALPTGFTLPPLSLLSVRQDSKEIVVGIDEDSPSLSDSSGTPLFDANGEYTADLQQRIDNIITITRQLFQARELCQLLAEKRLFRTETLRLQLSETTRRYEVEGVYMVDTEVLGGLSDQEFLELRQRDLLPVIYAHLVSLHQFGRLLRLQSAADSAKEQDLESEA